MRKRINLQLLNDPSINDTINNRLHFNYDTKMKFPLQNPVNALMNMHSAWYAGDPNLLHNTYKGMINQVGGSTRQSFWAKRIEDGIVKLHVPIASDIATASADMLFAEVPEITIPEAEEEMKAAREEAKAAEEAEKEASAPKPPEIDAEGNPIPAEEPEEAEEEEETAPKPVAIEPAGPGTQALERLEEIVDESGFANRLLEAAETCAAIGGVYLVPTWDASIADHPILAVNQADNAIPEFKWGYLTAVTFHKVVWEEEEDDIVYRHLEKHEPGNIHNALYKGTKTELGQMVPLNTLPAVAGLQQTIPTGWDKLMVRYIPNMKPNRRFRGSPHGQSDLAGIEPLLDALDEVYSSWLRDIRLARARIIVPESFLDFDEDSEGKKSPYFDIDRSVYTAMAMDPLTAKEGGAITLHQFEIRAEAHKQSAYELLERIVTHAGYSPQTFGLNMEGKAETGTALNIRERKTYITRGKKWKYWKHAIEDILEMMLHIDSYILKNPTPVLRPTVELADSMTNDIVSISSALQSLNNAQAVSIDTKVRMLNPDWSEEQIKAEVELIKEEQGIGAAPALPNSPIGGMSIGGIDEEMGAGEDDDLGEDDIDIIGEA